MKKVLLIIFLQFLSLSILSNQNIVYGIESFTWPSSGWVNWRYKDNNGNHDGIDIWSTQNGGWNGGVSGSSNPIYATYPGTLVWEGSIGYIIKHSDNLYSNYYHVRNRQIHPTTTVNSNTLLGYQDYDVTVHLHLTISSTNSGSGHIDPSPYLGMQLDVTKPGVIPSGTYIERTSCGGSSIIKENWITSGPVDCSATNSITVKPNSQISGTNGLVRLHVP